MENGNILCDKAKRNGTLKSPPKKNIEMSILRKSQKEKEHPCLIRHSL